jgi:hypothetical protein
MFASGVNRDRGGRSQTIIHVRLAPKATNAQISKLIERDDTMTNSAAGPIWASAPARC